MRAGRPLATLGRHHADMLSAVIERQARADRAYARSRIDYRADIAALVRDHGAPVTAVARKLGVSSTVVYRILEASRRDRERAAGDTGP